MRATSESAGEIEIGELVCGSCRRTFPIVRFIPRFVPIDSYQTSFGFQWNEFRKTQLDSHTGLPLSRDRLCFSTGWTLDDLAGRHVLDVGCGAGRFAEVALEAGAQLVALEYSSAVEACHQNFGAHPRLNVVQGDVYRLPFGKGFFDCVYCLGVLQHAPDVKGALVSLPVQLRPGGRLAVDFYPQQVSNFFWPKYWVRPAGRKLRYAIPSPIVSPASLSPRTKVRSGPSSTPTTCSRRPTITLGRCRRSRAGFVRRVSRVSRSFAEVT